MSKFIVSNPVNESEHTDFNEEFTQLTIAMASIAIQLQKRGIDIKSPHCWLTIQVHADGEYGEAFCISEQE